MKQLSIYTIQEDQITSTRNTILNNETLFKDFAFVECETFNKNSIGFSTTVLGDQEYVSEANGDIYLKVTTQDKTLNKYDILKAIKRKTEKYLSESENSSVPKPMIKAFKEEAEAEIISTTSPNEPKHFDVVFKADGKVFLSCTGKKADEITSLVRKVLGSLPVTPIQTVNQISDMMDDFVKTGVSDVFTLGEKASFVTTEDRVVNIKGDLYDSDEVTRLMKAEALTTSLEVNYDSVLTFIMKDDATLNSISFDKEFMSDNTDDQATSLILKVGELTKVVGEIVERTGG